MSRNPWLLTPQQLAIAAAIAVLVFLFVQFVSTPPRSTGSLVCRAGSSGFSIRSPISASPAGSCGRSAFCFWRSPRCRRLPRVSQLVLAAVMVRVGFLFAAIAVPGLFTNIVKHMIRARAAVGRRAVSIRICSARSAGPQPMPACRPAMPRRRSPCWWRSARSGRARAPCCWIYALLISVSRVVVTAHYPSDVLAGAVVGVVGALLVRRYFALRRLAFSIGPDGAVHQ